MKKKERKRMHLKEMWEDFSGLIPVCLYFLVGGALAAGIVLGISLSPWFFFLCAPAILAGLISLIKRYYY